MAEPEYRPPAHEIPNDGLGVIRWIVDISVFRSEREKIRRNAVLLVFFVLLVATMCLSARPMYRKFKSWRSRNMAAESLRLLEHGQNEAAFLKARSAFLLGGPQILTFRALAMALDGQNQTGQAYEVWKQLLSLGMASDDDRYAMIEAAISSGHIDEAEVELSKLPVYAARDLVNTQFAVRIKLARGQKAEALAEVRRLVVLHPEDGLAKLLLAQILALQGNEENSSESEQQLQLLRKDPAIIGIAALRMLALKSGVSNADSLEIAEALSKHALANDFDRLKALHLLLIGKPEERERLLDSAEIQYASASPELFSAFAAMLFDIHEEARCAKIISEERAISRVDLFMLRLEALASLQQWNEALALTQKGDLAIPRFFMAMFQARCQEQLGSDAEARLLWAEALGWAGSDSNVLRAMLIFAEKAGNAEQADRIRKAFETAIGKPQADNGTLPGE